jgi:hypothetical protein
VPVGVTGHRTQRTRGQVGPPGPHPAQPSSSLDPGGERGPITRPLAPLIVAQLVCLSPTTALCASWAGGIIRNSKKTNTTETQAPGVAVGSRDLRVYACYAAPCHLECLADESNNRKAQPYQRRLCD